MELNRAVLCGVVMLALLPGCSLFDSSESLSDVSARVTECVANPDPNAPVVAEIWMHKDASDQNISSAQLALESDAFIRDVSYIDRAETWKKFNDHYADREEIRELLRQTDMPTSFVVEFTSRAIAEDRAPQLVQEIASVTDVQLNPSEECESIAEELQVLCDKLPVETIVWLEAEVMSAQIAGLTDTLNTLDGATKVTFIDQEIAWADFVDDYQTLPDVRESVDSGIVPTHFIVNFPTRTAADAATPDLNELEFVDDVQIVPTDRPTTDEMCAQKLSDFQVNDIGP